MTLDLAAYLARIGYQGDRAPNLALLQALHRLHPAAIPFENLDPLCGRPVELDLPALQAKLIDGGRGGYCYEQNTWFAAALSALGFTVTALAASVLWQAPAGVQRPPTHMLLRVDLADGPWLADVGFGGLTLTAPLRLVAGTQPTAHELCRITQTGERYQLAVLLEQRWQPLYAFDLRPQPPEQYEILNWYAATHPASRFVQRLLVARALPDGRCTLLDRRMTIYQQGRAVQQERLGDAALLAALRQQFGLTLPDDPALHAALARLPWPEV